MASSVDREKTIAVAVCLLKFQNPKMVQILKDLLTFIPNPNQVKSVLRAAVVKLIYTSPESTIWLFQHPEVLEPEIQVREIIAQELTQTLISRGCQLEEFSFMTDQRLHISEDIKNFLLSYPLEEIEQPVLTLLRNLVISQPFSNQ